MNEEELQAQQAQANVPQDVPQAPQPQDPFDTSGDIAELQGIQKELQDVEASLENNFAEFITAEIANDPTFEDLFFSDRKTFFKKVMEMQNNFVKGLAEPLAQRAKEAEGRIVEKQELGRIDLIKKQFQAKHPDVDIQSLITFFINEVPPKLQEEIKNAPLEQFFDIVYEIYLQATGQGKQAEPQTPPPPQESPLPSQANGVAVNSENANARSGNLPMEMY